MASAQRLKLDTTEIAQQLTSNQDFMDDVASKIRFEEDDVMQHATPHLNRLNGVMEGLVKIVGQTSASIKTELTPLTEKVLAMEVERKESLDKIAPMVAKELTKDKLLEAMNGVVGRSVLSGVKNGTTLPLPSTRPVASEYCSATNTSELIRRSIKAGRHMMISGPSGSGKTYPLHQELNAIKRRHITISCADGVSYGDLIVRQELRCTAKGNETIWRLGLLPFCMENGIALVLDEVDQLAPELLQVLNACLESRELLIPATGDVIKAKDTWIVGVTLNSLRDDTGVYSGFRVDERTCQRFAFIPADYLPIQQERAVVESATGITGKSVEQVVEILTILRVAHFAGRLRGAPSTRIAIKLIRVMNGLSDDNRQVDGAMSLETALSYCYLGGMPKTQTSEAVNALMTSNNSVVASIGKTLAKQFSS